MQRISRVSVDNINPRLVSLEYAVRGEVLMRSNQIQKSLDSGNHKYPFNELTACNIGNPQAVGQKPISFFRQVLSCMEYPELIEKNIFPSDVGERAKRYLSKMHGMGAYSASSGLQLVKEDISAFIASRDSLKAPPVDDIFVTDGASPAVQRSLMTLIRNSFDGIMIPIPQYPLYSASIPLYGGTPVSYYLNEETGWSMSIDELTRAYDNAVANGINVRGIAIINPGNPTGQVLTKDNMEEIIAFCHAKGIVILADEVYQENIYQDKPFHSFFKVLSQMDANIASETQIVSFHSTSKGFIGECGHRGGYAHFTNFDADVKSMFLKLASVNLCSNVAGQIMMGLMVNPPKEGDASFEQYQQEKNGILESLKRRSQTVAAALGKMEGVSCNLPEGAMYAFPQIRLPQKAVEEAKKAGKSPDLFYSLKVLENTGLVVVPGSGFGQKDGTHHFRTTFLPPEDKMEDVYGRLADYHAKFLAEFK